MVGHSPNSRVTEQNYLHISTDSVVDAVLDIHILAADMKRKWQQQKGRPKAALSKCLLTLSKLERAKRFELSTLTLARLCSTPELRPLPWVGVIYKLCGSLASRKWGGWPEKPRLSSVLRPS